MTQTGQATNEVVATNRMSFDGDRGKGHETIITRSENNFWSISDHSGEDYASVLTQFHLLLAPKTYLEIGTNSGGSLVLANCPSIAIDTKFSLDQDVVGAKPACLLFQMSSDAFFAKYDPRQLLGAKIDMIFVDGMHLFEHAMRDFANSEKCANRNSIILLHDCIPTDAHIARRRANADEYAHLSAHPDWWAGDVWKVLSVLKKYRPDLRIHAFNSAPTGLAAITNLDPTSKFIFDNYYNIVSEFRHLNLSEDYELARYLDEIEIQDTKALSDLEAISELFWL